MELDDILKEVCDITARMMMVHAPGVFKNEFVVVNRVGGSGAAAMQYMLDKPRDGHTIALITQTHLLTILRSKGKFKYEDLVPLARATDIRDPAVGKAALQALRFTSGKAPARHRSSAGWTMPREHRVHRVRAEPTIVPSGGGGDASSTSSGAISTRAVTTPPRNRSSRPDVRRSRSSRRSAPRCPIPTGKEAGSRASLDGARFVTLRGVPRTINPREGLPRWGPSSDYLETSGQSLDSVVGAGPWKAQLDEFMVEGKKTLETLGLLK
jgi:hypothetical protein